MAKRKSKNRSTKTSLIKVKKDNITPMSAKIVLLAFGLGPIVLMLLFLISQGFFKSTF